MTLTELKNKYRRISALDKARTGWEDEYEVSSKQCMHGPNCKLASFCTVGRRLQEVNVLGGLILPVWGTIEKALAKQARQSHKRLRVVRIETTTDNQRIVGLLIPNAAVESVLQVSTRKTLCSEKPASVRARQKRKYSLDRAMGLCSLMNVII
ncbi:udp-glycosyltransferase [Sarracenia purpurea var. burkii]